MLAPLRPNARVQLRGRTARGGTWGGLLLISAGFQPNDSRALKLLEQAFPNRDIIPVYCRDLVWGLGTLHCMTQQQPA